VYEKIVRGFTLFFFALCFLCGVLTGYYIPRPVTVKTDNSQVARIVELTREHIVRDRAELASERERLEGLAIGIDRERKALDRQRSIASSDGSDLGELASLIENCIVQVQTGKDWTYNNDLSGGN
jgi:transposase